LLACYRFSQLLLSAGIKPNPRRLLMREVSVIYQDGMMGMVEPSVLQRLIDNDKIIKFQRASGWVYPEIDPVRSQSSFSYQGTERRFN